MLASSVHLVCRPRENPDGSLRTDDVGDWREVLAELPRRIHAWMPRLAEESVVGADAIFACLGPALEIYSRFSSVEKVNGENVTLKEYLEEVWAAVSREAMSMIFEEADASGFEEEEPGEGRVMLHSGEPYGKKRPAAQGALPSSAGVKETRDVRGQRDPPSGGQNSLPPDASVASMSLPGWPVETNRASNCDGSRQTLSANIKAEHYQKATRSYGDAYAVGEANIVECTTIGSTWLAVGDAREDRPRLR